MLIQSDNVIKKYKNQLALDYFSVEMREGEVLGLLGPNGAGKSTFIKALVGLLPINEGEIRVFGKIQDGKDPEIKRQIGYVTQEITIYEEMTARENLTFFGSLYGMKNPILKNRVEEVSEIIGLKEKLDKKAGSFSGGMKRRLNIGCSLVHNPRLLIMDEPTVGIDPQSRNYILEFVKKAQSQGMSILYTSHYIEEVEAVASKIVIMDQGHGIAEGTLQELISRIQGDSQILIDVRIAKEEVREALAALPDVKEVALNGNTYHIIVPGGVVVFDKILPILSPLGIVAINSKQPNLEDVFLTLTGKQLRDEVN
ncbi:ABC transporter ATP-binding protein [Proteiniclasticum ruminis]|uniref:ABC-2 type transport system ATP-binding protein n=1 Tax=Proteiniclasticum ruminis TaxID=398199 RepID=A0A1G8LNV0_9CLOT|nr:ABC transporter ATP-binding protein [Proteiniclasticum ruminis]SDI57391.1 ABC-2 type transport system ATP-binding protein [Proteiniclasticum ruminis]